MRVMEGCKMRMSMSSTFVRRLTCLDAAQPTLFSRMKPPLSFLAFAVLSSLALAAPVEAEVLKGRVEAEGSMRVARPGLGGAGAGQAAPPLRVARPQTDSLRGSATDISAFRPPLTGRAQDDGISLGLLKPNDFASIPPSKFNLGTERNSRELVLAWERWHKQLSEAIYTRWSQTADAPGRATLRITVTKDRKINPIIVRCDGGRRFERGLLSAIMSLDGNQGLNFPVKSERDQITFETDYVASTDVTPGYSWVKNDFERIRQEY